MHPEDLKEYFGTSEYNRVYSSLFRDKEIRADNTFYYGCHFANVKFVEAPGKKIALENCYLDSCDGSGIWWQHCQGRNNGAQPATPADGRGE